MIDGSFPITHSRFWRRYSARVKKAGMIRGSLIRSEVCFVNKEDFSPSARPFDRALSSGDVDPEIRDGAIVANAAIDTAKRILLQNRVQNFTSADVVSLARLILYAGE
jgi:hypothetical protein